MMDEQTEAKIKAMVDEGMSLIRDPTPEKRVTMEARVRRVFENCKRRTRDEWVAELDALDERLRELDPDKDFALGRRIWKRTVSISRFLYEDRGAPEPEWPWSEDEAEGGEK